VKQDKPHRGKHKHIWEDYVEPHRIPEPGVITIPINYLESDEKIQMCYLCKKKRVVKKEAIK
jgi:hypothetical protein